MIVSHDVTELHMRAHSRLSEHLAHADPLTVFLLGCGAVALLNGTHRSSASMPFQLMTTAICPDVIKHPKMQPCLRCIELAARWAAANG